MLKIIKNKSIKKQIQKRLTKKPSLERFEASHIQKIACIIDFEQVKTTDFLEHFVESYAVRSDSYVILGYKEKSTETNQNGIPLFTWKDIQFSGRIINYHADRLLQMEYDILINYFNEPKLPLLLLSSGINAKLRIGFEGIDSNFNDIILQCSPSQEAVFVEEVKKIIQIIR